jgi:ABC-2 type transport system ATP-binding protein
VNASAPAVSVEGLTKSYGRARGVIDLTFSVERGEVFGYLGPNGAGKTTTIRTLLDFIRPTVGGASILGLDSRRDAIEIHRHVGYLPGEFGLYERLTAREHLTYLGSLRGGVDERSIRGLAERFDLDPRRPYRVAIPWEQAEGRADPGVRPPPRRADPRRAHAGPGPADAAGVLPAAARGP